MPGVEGASSLGGSAGGVSPLWGAGEGERLDLRVRGAMLAGICVVCGLGNGGPVAFPGVPIAVKVVEARSEGEDENAVTNSESAVGRRGGERREADEVGDTGEEEGMRAKGVVSGRRAGVRATLSLLIP